MTPQQPDDPRHQLPEDGDPLLVRPFILREQDAPEAATAWPPAETWPSASLTGTREILSHRAGKRPAPAGSAAPAGRGRRFALAGAGAVAVIGLAAAGYGMLQPAPGDDDVPIPSGALPPLPSASPVVPPAAAPGSPARTSAPAGRASARAGATATTTKASPPATGTTPAPAATTPAVPAPQPPGLVAALSPAPTAARVGAIGGDGNLCLDLNGGVPVDDNHVQVFTCNGGAAQRWTLATDGTLRVVGKCAQVTSDATVHIIGCDGRTQAQWRAGADNTLVNVATNQCLTDPEAGARSGAGVRVTPCAGAGSQRWTLP